jgi:hypothetical protein
LVLILLFSKCFVRRYRVDSVELFVQNWKGRWAKGILSGYPQGSMHWSMHIDYITLCSIFGPSTPVPQRIPEKKSAATAGISNWCRPREEISRLFLTILPLLLPLQFFLSSRCSPHDNDGCIHDIPKISQIEATRSLSSEKDFTWWMSPATARFWRSGIEIRRNCEGKIKWRWNLQVGSTWVRSSSYWDNHGWTIRFRAHKSGR